jgi:hypothetical protein
VSTDTQDLHGRTAFAGGSAGEPRAIAAPRVDDGVVL